VFADQFLDKVGFKVKMKFVVFSVIILCFVEDR